MRLRTFGIAIALGIVLHFVAGNQKNLFAIVPVCTASIQDMQLTESSTDYDPINDGQAYMDVSYDFDCIPGTSTQSACVVCGGAGVGKEVSLDGPYTDQRYTNQQVSNTGAPYNCGLSVSGSHVFATTISACDPATYVMIVGINPGNACSLKDDFSKYEYVKGYEFSNPVPPCP